MTINTGGPHSASEHQPSGFTSQDIHELNYVLWNFKHFHPKFARIWGLKVSSFIIFI
jgi:hypothetical protein